MTQSTLTTPIQNNRTRSFAEFVALMALMIALVALSIDAMLPALPEIGQDLGVQRENDSQLIISLLFLGMAVGQIFYGPFSDSVGRKPAIYIGFALFILGCVLTLVATNFRVMLIGRLLQGIGVAGPRSVSLALVRDQYEGRAMARVMSFVMAVFILVPVIAPALGQVIILFAHWRAIFGLFLILALIMLVWFAIRQPETLALENRTPFSLGRIASTVREICANRIAFGYTITAGLISGAFLGYLNSAQQIFQEQYGLGNQFPLYFAVLALAAGVSSYMNARLVMRLGMRALSNRAMLALALLSTIFGVIAFWLGGHPALWMVMSYFILAFFTVGILFGNLNALAMEPLGHVAGVGSAVVGALSTLLSVPLGTLIGQSYNGTILPLIAGFALFSTLGLIVMRWAESK
ncbi:multidrug effflux MFS transporter [Chloroflexi bacterium TSY]|nr:multidrug effflux MFS transporter [Chloroflexi bacterium TSY]